MKYCFLTGLYGRADSLMVKRQGRSLVGAGYDVYMVLCDGLSDETKDGISFVSAGYKPKNRIGRLFTKKRILEKALLINADYYQISDPELLSIAPLLKKGGKKVLFNLREYYPEMIKHKEYIPKTIRGGLSRIYDRKMKRYLPLYDVVICVTDSMNSLLKDKWGLTNTMVVSNFPWVNNDFNLTFEEYCNRGNVLCYEGTIYYQSRQENVFKALEQLPQVHYVLAGKIDENYSFIKDLPYWSKVEFIDGFRYEDLPGILAKATIGNVFRDFFGNDGSYGVLKIFDSMEAALPILLADTPLYRELVKKYNCGICLDPNDTNQIEGAIRYLVEHKREAYEMGQNGRKAVLERFSWEKESEKYINVIKSLE